MEYLSLIWKFRAIAPRQLSRLVCSIPRKSTEGRQNCEHTGKTKVTACATVPKGVILKIRGAQAPHTACKVILTGSWNYTAGTAWDHVGTTDTALIQCIETGPLPQCSQCCAISVKLTEFGNWSLIIPKRSVISVRY